MNVEFLKNNRLVPVAVFKRIEDVLPSMKALSRLAGIRPTSPNGFSKE